MNILILKAYKMIVTHSINESADTIRAEYSKHMGPDWARYLNKLLISEYMDDLVFYIEQSYLQNDMTFPRDRSILMKTFKKTPLDKLKVVIIGDEPYVEYLGNGLAFGNYNAIDAMLSPELRNIKQCVLENCREGKSKTFDTSLEDWSTQGVLLLNRTLLSEKGSKLRHEKAFRNFTREIIKTIDKQEVDIVFVFTSKEQEALYKQYINLDYHHVLTTEGIKPNSEIFNQINDILEEELSPNSLIAW